MALKNPKYCRAVSLESKFDAVIDLTMFVYIQLHFNDINCIAIIVLI